MNDTPTATKLLADLAEAYRNALGLDGAHDAALKAAERFLAPMPSLEWRSNKLFSEARIAHQKACLAIKQLYQARNELRDVLEMKGMEQAHSFVLAEAVANALTTAADVAYRACPEGLMPPAPEASPYDSP